MPQDQKQLERYTRMLDQLANMYPEAEDEIQALQEKLADITPSDDDYEEPMEQEDTLPEMPNDDEEDDMRV